MKASIRLPSRTRTRTSMSMMMLQSSMRPRSISTSCSSSVPRSTSSSPLHHRSLTSSFQPFNSRLSPLSTSSFSSARHASTTTVKPFLLSDIGEGITTVQITQWHVEAGQIVEEFDPVVEVMSDKATVEISSPFTGRIKAIYGEVGGEVKVGKVLCEVEVESEGGEEVEEVQQTIPQSSSAPEELVEGASKGKEEEGVKARPNMSPANDVLATPSTRHLARLHNIEDLSVVPGTGKDGRITKGDLLAFVATSSPETSTPTSSKPAPSSKPSTPPSSSTPPTTSASPLAPIPLSPVRAAMFRSLSASLTIPHFSYQIQADVTSLTRLQRSLSSSIPPRWQPLSTTPSQIPSDHKISKLTLLPLIMKSLSHALHSNPLFLSLLSPSPSSAAFSNDGTTPQLIPRSSHDISLALSHPTTNELYTPLVPGVEGKSVFELAGEIGMLMNTAPGFPKPNRGIGTITLSNIGSAPNSTARTLSPILPPTGALAIIALGRSRVEMKYKDEKKAWEAALNGDSTADAGEKVPRIVLDISATADHRIVTGTELSKLVEEFRLVLENPGRLIGGP